MIAAGGPAPPAVSGALPETLDHARAAVPTAALPAARSPPLSDEIPAHPYTPTRLAPPLPRRDTVNAKSLGMAVVLLATVASVADAVERPPDPVLRVELDHDRLTLEARDQPLGRVVDELSRVTGVAVHLRVRVDATVTASLRGVPLEAGLLRIFGADTNLVFSYPSASTALPAELWVWPDRAQAVAADLRPLDSDEPPLANAVAMLHDPDPRARARAAAAMAATGDDSFVDLLARIARDDPERAVRAAAADALSEIGSWRALAALKYVTQAQPRAFTTHNGDQP